jgi:hypothetical protein
VNSSVNVIKESIFKLENHEKTSTDEVKALISALKLKKSSGYDNISGLIIKNLLLSAISFLSKIFNICLGLSYFPKPWKIGKVVAIA